MFLRVNFIILFLLNKMDDTHTKYTIGDKISYNGELGTVSRTKILGMRDCCAIQVKWADESKKQSILKYQELDDVSKV